MDKNNKTKTFFEKIQKNYDISQKNLDSLNKAISYIGIRERQVYNVDILINNKMVEVKHKLESIGSSLFENKESYEVTTTGVCVLVDLYQKSNKIRVETYDIVNIANELIEIDNPTGQSIEEDGIFSKLVKKLSKNYKDINAEEEKNKEELVNSATEKLKNIIDLQDEIIEYDIQKQLFNSVCSYIEYLSNKGMYINIADKLEQLEKDFELLDIDKEKFETSEQLINLYRDCMELRNFRKIKVENNMQNSKIEEQDER